MNAGMWRFLAMAIAAERAADTLTAGGYRVIPAKVHSKAVTRRKMAKASRKKNR